jgi:hypothetical protein
MGLFDKKYCDFCGNKISLLGNKKLEDANMCKDCAAKLSPWFSERRHSTKADIEKQLEYREQNKSAVASFSATRTLGTASTKLLIDDNAKKFMVTSAKDLNAANPDVLDFSQAVGCDLDVKENRHEIRTTDSSGKSVSYNPPRYKYSYEFHAIIRVDHPYFDDMRFALSNGYIEVGEQPMNPGQSGGWSVSRSGFNLFGNKIDEYYKCVDCGNEIKAAVDAMRTSAAQAASQPDTRVLDTIKAETEKLREKIDAARATGNIDPTEMSRYMMLQQSIAIEAIRQPDNHPINALIDEAQSLALKIDAQRQAGTPVPQDEQRYQMLTQRITAEGLAIQMGALRMGAMGSMGAMGAGAMGAARPLDPNDPSGSGVVPIQQMPMQPGFQQVPMQPGFQQVPMQPGFQQMPQAAPMPPVPAIGSQVVCQMCGATVTIGKAGICTNCGNKLV